MNTLSLLSLSKYYFLMNYKAYFIPDNISKFDQDSQDDFFIEENANEIDYEKFSAFLDNLISCDNIDIEKNTVSLINRFRNNIKQFYENKLKFTNIDLFREKKIVEFLTKHASMIYTFDVREASLMSIATFLAIFPQFSDAFIQYGYIDILNVVFKNYLNEKNKILLVPAYKGLGNLIHNLQTVKFEYNLFYKMNEIDFDSFINSTSVFEPIDCLCLNYTISNIFRQSYKALLDTSKCFLLSVEQIIQILQILNLTICSTINEETCSNNLHIYALIAIDLFVKSNIYDAEFRKDAIIKSQVYNTINRYFEVEEGLYCEKTMVLSIISTFYKLDIPDNYNLIEAIIPFLLHVIKTQEVGGIDVYSEEYMNITEKPQKHTQRGKNIRRICDSIKEILESPYRFDALGYFYSIDALNALCSSLNDTKKLKEKVFITGIIAFFVELNSECLPLNDFFFTENCIESFLSLLDGDNNDFNQQVIKAIYIIFDASVTNGQVNELIQILNDGDGIEVLRTLKDSNDDYSSAYAIRVLEIVESN